MSADNIAEAIAEVVERVSGVPAAQVAPESAFADDLGMDSLTLMDVVVGVEDRFGVRINDDDIAGLRTVADAVDYIEAARVGA
jgi:acyl carrier protein